jgi:hypothetical protein
LDPHDPAELRAEALQLLRKSFAISQHGIQGTWGEEASFILPANAIRAWRPIEVIFLAPKCFAWLRQCEAIKP